MKERKKTLMRTNVRLTAEELRCIDNAAQKAGMSRNAYIRYLVRASGNERSAEVLEQLADTLRELQVAQRDYLRGLLTLLEMAEKCEGSLRDEAVRAVTEVEIPAARELSALLLSLEADVSRVLVGLRPSNTEPEDQAS